MALLLFAYGATRLVGALQWQSVLAEFKSVLSPLYLAASGGAWIVLSGALLWGIIQRRRWARFALLASAVLWYVQYWIEQLQFEVERNNVNFALTVTTTALAIVMTTAFLPSAKNYFQKS
ncbi:MAG: hypothetical protein HKUEN02_17040 [Anaerolineaceae bacterium]|nr:MAG: hypothetical protein HKUEN02_17040 [Anaerolineaceae bacterium]